MYEWDEAKRRANIAKHGVDFTAMERFDFVGAALVDTQVVDHELRHVLVGFIDADLYTAVITDRGEAIRVISLRRANRRERRLFDAEDAT